MDRPAFLGLPDGPVYSDDELNMAFENLSSNTAEERMEFQSYMRERKAAREMAAEKASDKNRRSPFGGKV